MGYNDKTLQYLELYKDYLELGVTKSEGFTPCKCPFHEDKDKSAGVNLQNGVFNCFSCKIKGGATWFISKITKCSYEQATILVEDFKKSKNLIEEINNFSTKYVQLKEQPNWRKLYNLSKEISLDKTFADDYCKAKGLTLQTLKDNDVGYLSENRTPWGRESLVFPYFYKGVLTGLRFRDPDGNKSGLEKSSPTPWGIDTLNDSDSVVILVEGETDRLRLLQECNNEYKVISLPGSFISQQWERDFTSFNKVILIPDDDKSGQDLSKRLKQILKDKLEIFDLPWARYQTGKDLTEWLAHNPFQNIKEKLSSLYYKNSKIKTQILKTTDFTTLEVKEKKYYIENFILPGQIVIIGGPQKARKTWLTLNLIKTFLTPDYNFLGLPNLRNLHDPPKILYIQTEGSKEKFIDRIELVLGDCPNKNNCFWSFRPGWKLDINHDIDRLKEIILENDINIIIFDPYQRMHSQIESTSVDIVWNNVHSLIDEKPDLSVIIIHHFSKDSKVEDKWDSLRGSSRMGGEADVGVFIEKDGDRNRISFDFRDEEPLKDEEGFDIFDIQFNETTGLMKIFKDPSLEKYNSFLHYIRTNCLIKHEQLDILKKFNITAPTLRKWVKRSNGLVTMTKPAPGNPVILAYANKQ